MRNKPLPNFMEKKLIVARYFIKEKDKGNSFDELGIYNIWTNCFPKDFRLSKNQKFKLKNDGNCNLILVGNKTNVPNKVITNYSSKWRKAHNWIIHYVEEHTLEDCNKDLERVRADNLHNLIKIYKPLNYYVKQGTMGVSHLHLVSYHIFQDSKQYSGTFDDVVEYSKTIR